MKYAFMKVIIFILYILLLLINLKFRISLIINIRMISTVIIGTSLLTFADYIKNSGKHRLLEGVKITL